MLSSQPGMKRLSHLDVHFRKTNYNIRMHRFLLTFIFVLGLITIGGANCAGNFNNNPARLNEPGLIDIHAHIGSFRGYDLSLNNLLINIAENQVEYAFISNIDGADVDG